MMPGAPEQGRRSAARVQALPIESVGDAVPGVPRAGAAGFD